MNQWMIAYLADAQLKFIYEGFPDDSWTLVKSYDLRGTQEREDVLNGLIPNISYPDNKPF